MRVSRQRTSYSPTQPCLPVRLAKIAFPGLKVVLQQLGPITVASGLNAGQAAREKEKGGKGENHNQMRKNRHSRELFIGEVKFPLVQTSTNTFPKHLFSRWSTLQRSKSSLSIIME
ncbi:Hypothetical_protein [Hexamita inflata]|uniref:Hypothetical_protein n=1 Tax=Hexamita inflata TaxID=28002 RepID=A0AA86P8J6_9EUKA|nr:Hypothetical protein HINF_LOCUS21440 [Hexamita inflata]